MENILSRVMCWVFGHNQVAHIWNDYDHGSVMTFPTRNCMRCGKLLRPVCERSPNTKISHARERESQP